MQVFETIVANLLQREGWWTRSPYWVPLTAKEALKIERPTMRRWELDIVAYRPGKNLIRVVECKAYMHKGGVKLDSFAEHNRNNKRYKLFVEKRLRPVVFQALRRDLTRLGLIPKQKPMIEIWLAAAQLYQCNEKQLAERLCALDASLYGPSWIKNRLAETKDSPYENDVVTTAVKLLLGASDGQEKRIDRQR